MNRSEWTRLAQQHDQDDLDDVMEEQCPSTRTNASTDIGGLSSAASKEARSRKKSVRNARKLKEKFREHARSRVDQWP